MKLKTLFMALDKFCTKKYLDFPDGGYTLNGETFTFEQLRYELRKLKEWLYPEKTDKVVLVHSVGSAGIIRNSDTA